MARSPGMFIWYELMTNDATAAADFYGKVIGWKIAPHADPGAGAMDYRMIGRADGGHAGGVLTLTEEMCAHGARPCWLGYLHSTDVDATVDAIVAEGGKVMMPTMDLPVGRIAMVADPQGAPFYVMTPVPPAGRPDAESDVFSVDVPQHVRWNELATDDPAAATAFYARHFNFAQEGAMPMGALGDYLFIQHDAVGIGAIYKRMAEMPVNAWTYYIGVDDIDRAVTAVTANGGSLFNGPMEVPGGEYAANAMDPQGAAFGIVGPRSS